MVDARRSDTVDFPDPPLLDVTVKVIWPGSFGFPSNSRSAFGGYSELAAGASGAGAGAFAPPMFSFKAGAPGSPGILVGSFGSSILASGLRLSEPASSSDGGAPGRSGASGRASGSGGASGSEMPSSMLASSASSTSSTSGSSTASGYSSGNVVKDPARSRSVSRSSRPPWCAGKTEYSRSPTSTP